MVKTTPTLESQNDSSEVDNVNVRDETEQEVEEEEVQEVVSNESVPDEIEEKELFGKYMGQVKWFNDKNGYGFITSCGDEEKGKDIFVHHSGVKPLNSNYKTLRKGEYVQFNIINGMKGLQQCIDVTGIQGGPLMCDFVITNKRIGGGPLPPHGNNGGHSQFQENDQNIDWQVVPNKVRAPRQQSHSVSRGPPGPGYGNSQVPEYTQPIIMYTDGLVQKGKQHTQHRLPKGNPKYNNKQTKQYPQPGFIPRNSQQYPVTQQPPPPPPPRPTPYLSALTPTPI